MKVNLFLALESAQRRLDLANVRVEKWEYAQLGLSGKIIDAQMHDHPERYRSHIARWTRERDAMLKYLHRAIADRDRWQDRADEFTREINERKRRAAIGRKKAGKQKPAVPKKKPPKGKGAFQYVLKVDYSRPARPKSGGKPKDHAVWWDVRLQKVNGAQATARELRAAIGHIRAHGAVPVGWKVQEIRWDRGKRQSWDAEPSRSTDIRGGDPGDVLGSLSATLGRSQGDDFTISAVKGGIEYEVGEELVDDAE